MTSAKAFTELSRSLEQVYDKRESENIADWVLEHITGKRKYARNMEKNILNTDQQQELKKLTDELLTNKPVQYVLNESFFCGYKFFVNESVLIPRPETEELVYRIVEENKKRNNLKILDIGTGSGCIPIALQLKLNKANITSLDISEAAIRVAKKNAESLGAEVQFRVIDFSREIPPGLLPCFDIIVSNPPYIPQSEKETLDKNVADFEPGIALFVPDNDPLIFYKKIEQFARKHLNEEGIIYLEVHENYAGDVSRLFETNSWKVLLIKDMYKKERIIKVTFCNLNPSSPPQV